MNRRERKKEETRLKIITCAVNLFRAKGFQETFMEEIAETADIAKGTLYNYFSDKESILVGYFQNVIAEEGQAFMQDLNDTPGVEERLHKLLDFINRIISDETDFAGIYIKFRMQTLFDGDPFDNPHRSGSETILLKIIQVAQERKEVREDIPALILARNFQFLIRGYLAAKAFKNEPLDLGSLKDQLIGLFLNGAKRQL